MSVEEIEKKFDYLIGALMVDVPDRAEAGKALSIYAEKVGQLRIEVMSWKRELKEASSVIIRGADLENMKTVDMTLKRKQ